MKKITENVLDFLIDSTKLIHDKLGIMEEFHFELSTVEEKHNPDLSRHMELNGIYARRFDTNEWQAKLDRIITLGFSGVDLMAILSPKNKGAKTDCYLIASIFFRLGSKVLGQIELIREYNESVLIKEFSMCQYNINATDSKKMFEEISVDWESGIKLLCMSILDCNRNFDQFIKDRT